MTPQEINTAARQRYNAVGDDLWADAEIYDLIYHAQTILATEGLLIERTFTTTSVASQQEYAWPSNAIAIKRATYNGRKLDPFTFREDDVITGLNQSITSTGTPSSYAFWNDTFYVRPIPDTSSVTIKVWAYVRPQTVSATSTMEVPIEWHMDIVYFVLSEMNAKNKNYDGANYYSEKWKDAVLRAQKFAAKRKRRDAFAVVKNVDVMYQNMLGNI